jgi:hypothetical protein
MIKSIFDNYGTPILIGASPVTVLIYEIFFEAATQFHHSNWKLPFAFEKKLNKLIVMNLTQNPAAHEQQNFTSPLKDKGLDDTAILDVVLFFVKKLLSGFPKNDD